MTLYFLVCSCFAFNFKEVRWLHITGGLGIAYTMRTGGGETGLVWYDIVFFTFYMTIRAQTHVYPICSFAI